jgi:O-antigen ligase
LNWQAIRNLTHVQIGAFLALLIVLFLPNYGIEKFGPSPTVPAFLLSLLGVWLVWRQRATLFSRVAQRRWLTAFLLLFVPVALSVPGSLEPRVSASIAVVLFLFYFTGVALIESLRADAERDWLIRWVAVVIALWVADTYVQIVFGRDLFGIETTSDHRVLGPFAGNLRLALFVCFLLPMLLVRLFPYGWIAAIAAFALAGVAAMLSGSRSILVFLAVIGASLFLRFPGGRRKWLVVGILALVGGVVVMTSPVLTQRLELFGELRHPTFASLNHILSYRLWIWDTALNMLAEHPFTGVGVGAFQAAYDRYSTLPGDIFHLGGAVRAFHPHQLYVGLAAETGLIGLLAFCTLVALALRWYWQANPDRRRHAWPFALGLLVYVFPVNSQPPLYLQWLFPVMVLLLTGMLASLDESGPGKTPDKQV